MTITYPIRPDVLFSTVKYLQETRKDHGLVLGVISDGTRPILASHGDLKGHRIIRVTIRSIVAAGWDNLYKKPTYCIHGTQAPLLANECWMKVSDVDRWKRIYKAVLPNGFPPPVRSYLLCGSSHEENGFESPRVLRWLAAFYAKLSQAEGDYAAVESEQLLRRAQDLENAASIAA